MICSLDIMLIVLCIACSLDIGCFNFDICLFVLLAFLLVVLFVS